MTMYVLAAVVICACALVQAATIPTVTSDPSMVGASSTEPSMIGASSTDPSMIGASSTEPSMIGASSTTDYSMVGNSSTDPSMIGASSTTDYSMIGNSSTDPSTVGASSTDPSMVGASSTDPSMVGASSTTDYSMNATEIVTTQAPTKVTNVQCIAGFVQCGDGRCEPFSSLCEEAGVVTIATKAPVTIETTPMASMVTDGQTETRYASMVTDGQTKMNSAGMMMTTDMKGTVDPATVGVTESVTMPDGSCKTGFVKCTDGRCEPYEQLCGDSGVVTIATKAPVTIETTPMASMVTDGQTETRYASMVTDGQTKMNSAGMMMTTDMKGTVDPATVDVTESVTMPDGSCKTGFVKCTDGRCEPYEQLCGDSGFVTLPTISIQTTLPTSPGTSDPDTTVTSNATVVSMVTNAMSDSTIVSMVTKDTATTDAPASTLPTTVATLPPLDNGCPPGYEMCPDKQCEPFHFMCDEHSVTALIGR